MVRPFSENSASTTIARPGSPDEGSTWRNRKLQERDRGTKRISVSSRKKSTRLADARKRVIPLLALGIPGSASTAVLLGGLIVQGVAPGPLLLEEQAPIVYSLYAGFLVAVALMLVVGLLGIPIWTRVVSLRASILMPLVVGVSLFLVVVLAAVNGACIPLVFQKLGIDPAVASGPLVTTSNDITGILIYFGMAYLLIDLLLH